MGLWVGSAGSKVAVFTVAPGLRSRNLDMSFDKSLRLSRALHLPVVLV